MKKIGCLITILWVIITLSCTKKEAVQEKKFLPVSVITLKPKTISSTISVAGTVDSKVHAWVNSPTEGTVQALKVVEGQKVSAGQILCYVTPTDYYNMLGQASAEYERAKSDFESAPDTEKDIYEKRLKAAEERLISARNLYKSTPVVSPVNGTVLSKNIETGTNVSAKQPLIEIADLRKLIVRTAISEENVSRVKLGQEVAVRLHSLDKILKGKISVITPGIRLESRTAGIEVSIPLDTTVRPGMSASLDITLSSKDNVLAVPQDAMIVKPDGGKFVFIVEEDIAKLKKIATGLESNTEIEVTSGLNENDKVVVLGQDNLKDGVKVKVIEPGKSEKQESSAGKEK
ncbi:MAG: efflux RND transporter periplasmic adaptor subunit [bacterium]